MNPGHVCTSDWYLHVLAGALAMLSASCEEKAMPATLQD